MNTDVETNMVVEKARELDQVVQAYKVVRELPDSRLVGDARDALAKAAEVLSSELSLLGWMDRDQR